VNDLPAWAWETALGEDRIIREARPDEYSAAEDVLVAAFTTGCWVAPGYQRGLRSLDQRAATWHIWVALDRSGQVLGVVLTPRVRHWDQADFTFSVLAVGPAGRGLGLGGALVDHCVKLARSYGFDRILIHSSPQMSRAHRLYYDKGFVRRIDQETVFVSEFEERLLTFTYRVPDRLPASQIHRLPHEPAPGRQPMFGQRPGAEARASWPLPAQRPEDDPAVQRATWMAEHLRSAGRLDESDPAAEALLRSQITHDIWGGLQTAIHSSSGYQAELALRVFYARLDWLEARLARQHFLFLHGDQPSSSDTLLASLLLAFDLGGRAALGYASGAVAYWPRLWNLARRLVQMVALSKTELQRAGLEPLPDGSYSESFGPLPPNFVLADPRAAWLEPPDQLRRPLAPLDPSVPPTPWSGDLPPVTAIAEPLRDLAVPATDDQPPEDTEAAIQLRLVEADLVDGIGTLAAGADGPTQVAVRRLLFARLAWLDDRLSAQPYLRGTQPGAWDCRLARFLALFGEGRLMGLPPIDPVLEDFPALVRYSQHLQTLYKC
jgi:putative glutathione S-transferase